MSIVLEHSISAETMRNGIRAKLAQGASREAVCWLVCAFAPAGIDHHRSEGTVPRVAVEVIPADKRQAFLDALAQLRETPNRGRGVQHSSVRIQAEIVFANGRSSMPCEILDVSETGALVKPAEADLCPKRFLLKPQSGTAKECEIVWRKGDRIRLRYMRI